MYQPIPDGRLYRTSGGEKKKSFKAKHFPFTVIQIGSYKVNHAPLSSTASLEQQYPYIPLIVLPSNTISPTFYPKAYTV